MKNRPLVGVGVFIHGKDNEYLLGKRKGAHGAGEWSLPGGHLEFNESFEDCCRRESLEETNLSITNIKQLGFTNDIFLKDSLHYVTLFFHAECNSGPLKLMEPDKCEKWKWFDIDNLPTPLFPPLQQFIRPLSQLRS